ncbi:DUF1853 family protein [Burkholderiaceae bacterium DAT-1]|nr:DUF1853 family protein [Burkholderiaceae bacterium DAT-1]
MSSECVHFSDGRKINDLKGILFSMFLDDTRWLLTSPQLVTLDAERCRQIGETLLRGFDLAYPPPFAVAEDIPPRLGRYAEHLMQHHLARLPDLKVLAAQHTLKQNGRTLGELDFLIRWPDAQLLHIELSVKIYIAFEQKHRVDYIGPGLRDALILKLRKLQRHQLQLTQREDVQSMLGIDHAADSLAWIKGWIFYRNPSEIPVSCLLNPAHLKGWWRHAGEPWPSHSIDSRWRILARHEWMAPRTGTDVAEVLATVQKRVQSCQLQRPIMLAEYAPPDAGGCELARGLVLPDGWPDPVKLDQLLDEIDH